MWLGILGFWPQLLLEDSQKTQQVRRWIVQKSTEQPQCRSCHQDTSFTEKRRKSFENYLTILLSSPVVANCEELRSFLSIEGEESETGDEDEDEFHKDSENGDDGGAHDWR